MAVASISTAPFPISRVRLFLNKIFNSFHVLSFMPFSIGRFLVYFSYCGDKNLASDARRLNSKCLYFYM